MASLGSYAIAGLFAIGVLSGQDVPDLPVPLWPDGGPQPSGRDGKYVYLTKDRHSIVVLVPEDPAGDPNSPRRVVRVPLKIDLKPSITLSLNRSGRLVTYSYSIKNAADARDPIGSFTLVVPVKAETLDVAHKPASPREPWGGAIAGSVVASQPLFPWLPRGRYLYWFRSDNVVPPGGALDGFNLVSSNLPGITRACLSSGELVEFDRSWPPEVFRQLELLEDRRFREVCMPAIGPVFLPETSKRAIREELYRDLQAMTKAALVDSSSPFIADAIRFLANDKATGLTLQVPPQTDMERMIEQVIRFAL